MPQWLLNIYPRRRISFGHIEVGGLGRAYLNAALDSNWISEGPNVRLFEAKFKGKFGYRHALATSSGTDAGTVAMAALLGLGAERGDEVITPALAFSSTANCILAAGLKPVFVDAELDTLNIAPSLIDGAISSRSRAIQYVHTMGKICNMFRPTGMKIIEDCCEAHGALLGDRYVGDWGDIGIFSFYAAHIICSGEGGMVVTDDDEIAALCRVVGSHGRRDGKLPFNFDRVGFNSKMNDMEAAIGLEGLDNFDRNFHYRRMLRHRLDNALAHLEDDIIIYKDAPGEVMCPHAYPIVIRDALHDAEGLYHFLEGHGIEAKTLFGSLPTQHRAFEFLGYQKGDFPVAERIGRCGLQLGIHQYLTEEDIDYVAETISAYFDGGRHETR